MAETTVRNVTLQLHIPRTEEAPTAFHVVDRGRRGERSEPLDGRTVLRALVRTHVVANLLVAYYCARIRFMLRAAGDAALGETGKAAARLMDEMLGSDDASATNASRSLYKPLSDPASSGGGLAAASESGDSARRRNALLDALLQNPSLIERAEMRAIVAPTGRVAGCFEHSDTSESGLRTKSPWDDKRAAQLAKKVGSLRPPLAGANPLVDLKRAGWLEHDSPHRLRGVAELLRTDSGRVSAELGYGTFALAAARLATNRSWTKRRAEERVKQAQAIEQEFAGLERTDWWRDLDGYVREAEARYARESGHAVKSGYRFGDGGELKGWGRIRRVWLRRRWSDKQEPPAFDELRKLRLAEQKLRPEEHGDHALFDWLAEPEHWHLWDGRDAPNPAERGAREHDRVSLRARHSRLSRPMNGIDFTWPDPLRHPVWIAFGEGGGPNELPWHELHPVGDARRVTLGLLFVGDDGKLEERDVRLRIGENRRLTLASDGTPMLDRVFPVEIGGGKLMLHRPTLDRIARAMAPELRRLLVAPEQIDGDRIEKIVEAVCNAPAARRKAGLRAYLGIALKIPVPARASFLPLRKTTVRFNHKDSQIGFLPKHVLPEALVRPEIGASGLRVLGVDLGVRFAAAFALVQLREKDGPLDRADQTKRPRRAIEEAPGLVACIERRGALRLDGEGGGDEAPPPRLDRAARVVRFARRVVDRQNLAARVLRRALDLEESNLRAEDRQKERARLERDLALLIPASEAAPVDVVGRPWEQALEDVQDALAAALPATRDGLVAASEAERAALAALVRASTGTVTSAAVAHYLQALDSLAIATHRFARQSVAHPVAVAVGVAERSRRNARKAGGERLPITKVSPEAVAMGGLSIERIEFLEDLLRYERKHATRSRPTPGGPPRAARLSRAQPFMPALRDRITRIKADRCKKIAALIVEAALGGEPDFLGHRKHPAAHVIALEDLSRYKFFGDRTKRENRRLLAWSHREIFRWVVMQAELHGLIVAAVPAGYSSRFSATSGAPGVRVETVKPAWLDAPWWKRAATDGRNLGWRDAREGEIVVKDGGPEFVGVDAEGRRVNADENAAANLALRFLSSPTDQPMYLRLERREDGTYEATTKGAMQGTRFRRVDEKSPVFVPVDANRSANRRSRDDDPNEEDTTADGEKRVRIFRDPTGVVGKGKWLEDRVFWGIVRARVAKAIGSRLDDEPEPVV